MTLNLHQHHACLFQDATQCKNRHTRTLDQSAASSVCSVTPRAKPGEGAFECHECDKRFSSKQYLRHHLATVHGIGEVPKFACDLCPRVYGQKSHLGRHMKRAHASERPWPPPGETIFECEVCDERFASKRLLRYHRSEEHGIGTAHRFRCDVCSRVYSQKSHLNRHMKNAHG